VKAVFLYGTLRDPDLLAVVLGRDAGPGLAARLPGYRAVRVAGDSHPAILADSGASADGVVLQDLSKLDLARLDHYEGAFGYALGPARVETANGPVAARLYWPEAELPLTAEDWTLAAWQAEDAGLLAEAAGEWMAQFGRVPAADMVWRWPQMRRRAHARRLGAATRVPRGPATAMGRADLADHHVQELWGGFFTVEQHDLTVPTLAGGPPQRIHRQVFVTADAALVLPWDPARDRVLLIEQFRPGPLARHDPAPWLLEPVAGLVDAGETPEATARRETVEEAGIAPQRLIPITSCYASPGACTDFFHCFLGLCDLPDDVAGHHGLKAETEDIRTHAMPFDTAMGLVESGAIRNAPLILMLLWLARHRDRLRADR
jgi:ADP-ribose pyrophosphatase